MLTGFKNEIRILKKDEIREKKREKRRENKYTGKYILTYLNNKWGFLLNLNVT